jgi:hypothetical protein
METKQIDKEWNEYRQNISQGWGHVPHPTNAFNITKMSITKRNPPVMYKLGYTTTTDAEIRFSEKYHNDNNFKFTCLGRDYNVRCVWSGWFTQAQADGLEAEWAKFPKNIYTDIQYNGITECRYYDHNEYRTILNKYRLSYPTSEYSFKVSKAKHRYNTRLVKAYLMEFTKKTNTNINTI